MQGSTEPRIYTPPLKKLTRANTKGYEFIDFAKDVLQVDLLPWQEWLAIHALETVETKDTWHFRYRTVCVLIARQNGKSLFAACLALYFMYVLGVPLTVGTAQNLDMAEEAWEKAVDMAESNTELSAEISQVLHANGKKAIELKTGERYKVAAATRKGGRGLSSDFILMDELREHTNWDAWGAVTKSTMARSNALVWCMSNAGDDQSVVLSHLRLQAHKACGDPDHLFEAHGEYAALPDEECEVEDDTLAIFEWSAEPNAALDTREQVLTQCALANPSMGYGFLTERALLSAWSTDPENVFKTECLCQWVEAIITPPFPEGAWEAGIDPESAMPTTAQLFFGLDMSADRSRTSIAVCGMRADGCWHIEIIASRKGFEWVKEWLATQGEVEIALQARGAPIAAYIQDLQELENVHVTPCEGRDIGAWTGRFYDSVCAPITDSDAIPIYHRAQPLLDKAATTAQKKSLGDAAWGWDRKNSVDDVSPLVAATMAYGLATGGKSETREYASAYADDTHELIIL